MSEENENTAQDFYAVKAAGDYELDVLAVPYGGPKNGRDTDGQYFSPRTDTLREQFKSVPIFLYHGMDARQNPVADPEPIGTAEYHHTDSAGDWYRATLSKTAEAVKALWEAAKAGTLRASSGAISHLVRIAKDGEILKWPLAELSLMDSATGMKPANSYAVALPRAKANYKAAGLTLPGSVKMDATIAVQEMLTELGIDATPELVKKIVDAMGTPVPAMGSAPKGDAEMNIEETIKKILAEQKAAEEQKAAKETEKAEAVKAARIEWEKEAAAANRLPSNRAPYQAKFSETWKYDNLQAADLSLMAGILQSRDKPVSPSALKAMALKISELKDNNTRESHEAVSYVKSAFKAATGIDPTAEAIKGVTDPMLTTGTTDGGNWVIPAYSAELWRVIRAENRVVAKIPAVTIPDGYPSDVFPIEGTDPTWYKVAEVTTSANPAPDATVTASQITTPTKFTLSVAKAGARTLYSGEMTEDSIIPIASQIREQMNISGAEMMENVVINGDTTASIANINDGNSGGGGAAGTEIFTLMNGFRKLALVTNAANSRGGGTMTEDDFLETMWLMGAAGLAGADLAKCSFVIDPNVYKKALQMASLKTKDVWTNATLESGVLTKLWGYDVIPSWQFCANSTVRKSSSNGKIDIDTVANNVYGSILGIRWDQWKLGYKRRTTIETTRFANSDSWEIVALVRFGLQYRDAEAAAITYGLNV